MIIKTTALASALVCAGAVAAIEQTSSVNGNLAGHVHHSAAKMHGQETVKEKHPQPPTSEMLLNESKQPHYLTHKNQMLNLKKSPTKSAVNKVKSSSTTTTCNDPSMLSGLTGSELVNTIKQAELSSCMYGVYNTNFVGTALFSDNNLQSVVDSIDAMLVNYDATDLQQTRELENLVTFLRAMHWAEYQKNTNRVFTANYHTSLQQVFSDYFSGVNFSQFNGSSTRDFMIRYEMLVLLNSSGTNRQPYLLDMSRALVGYANTVSQTNDWGQYYEELAITRLLTHFYNATSNQESEMSATLTTSPEIIDNLSKFVTTDAIWLVEHTRQYQWNDAINELGRMLYFGGNIAQQVRPAMQHVLSNYSHDGPGGDGWINAQGMVAFYDQENCDLYGDVCQFDLEAAILSGSHTCSTTIKLRYQSILSEQQLDGICTSLSNQESEFHQLFGTTSDSPVANDENTDLEIVLFSSYSDYDGYANQFFGINTNNGGMYLEGTPSDTNNQARFIAYQATWLQPEFIIWNLNHEYIHYLDGRYNSWGSFSQQPSNSVWWSEGLAEYLSQPDNNSNALSEAADTSNNYHLSELFDTTYQNSDTARTYYWGYLAVRFMFERHENEITNQLLPSLRAAKGHVATTECTMEWQWRLKTEAITNDWFWAYDDSANASGNWVWTCGQPLEDFPDLPAYTPYQDILDNWNTQFDDEFDEWLACLVEGEGQCNSKPNIQPNANSAENYIGRDTFVIEFNAELSTDDDGEIVSYVWDFGNEVTKQGSIVDHVFDAAGSYTVYLTVTDDDGASDTQTILVNVLPIGDVDGDGDVDSLDIRGFTLALRKGELLDPSFDLNGDGVINSRDAREIRGLCSYERCSTIKPPLKAPQALASTNSDVIANSDVLFNSDGSTDQDGQIKSFYWDFGDGNSSVQANPIHQYSRAGTYEVTLTVTDNDEMNDSHSIQVNVKSSPLNACPIEGSESTDNLLDSEPRCIEDRIHFAFGKLNEGHSSIAITLANAAANTKIYFGDGSYPNVSNEEYSAISVSQNNQECIVYNVPEDASYWGYITLDGEVSGSTIVVDFGATACRDILQQ